MTTFRNTPAPVACHATADWLLRDVAFVLKMARKVKAEMIADRATAATAETDSFSRPEPEVFAA